MTVKGKQVLSTILACVNFAGTIGGFVATVFAAPKAKEAVDKLKSENPNATKFDIIKTAIPKLAIPASIALISAIAGGASTILSRKAEISLSASILSAENLYRRYSGKVKEKIGTLKNNEILKDLSKEEFKCKKPALTKGEKQLYWEEHAGFFYATPERLQYAHNQLCRLIIDGAFSSSWSGYSVGICTLADFMYYCEADFFDPNRTLEKLLGWGWSCDYCLDDFDSMYVDMDISDDVNDDTAPGTYKIVTFCIPEISNYENFSDEDINKEYMLRDGPKEHIEADRIDPKLGAKNEKS